MSRRVLSSGAQNLINTYVALGRHAHTAQLIDRKAYVGCTGEVEHAISNFAMRLKLDEDSAVEIREMALGRRVFFVYHTDEDSPESIDLLKALGFKRVYSLIAMESRTAPSEDYPDIVTASDSSQRRELAGFMTDQFFRAQPPRTRQAVTMSTAAAVRLQLSGIYDQGMPIASVMAHRSAGCLGLYNLCVLPVAQERGLGSSLVRFVQKKASDLGMPVSLQCDRRLQSWYERLGFQQTGVVDVLGLSKRDG